MIWKLLASTVESKANQLAEDSKIHTLEKLKKLHFNKKTWFS
jgi:hypothetical protein